MNITETSSYQWQPYAKTREYVPRHPPPILGPLHALQDVQPSAIDKVIFFLTRLEVFLMYGLIS